MKIKYAAVSEKGLRGDMEDSFCVHVDFGGRAGEVFAGVFDGHGTTLAAKQAAQLIPSVFLQKMKQGMSVRRAFRESYHAVSDSLLSSPGGACALTLFLRQSVAFFANAGDCGLCAFRHSRFQAVTTSHRVGNRKEEDRVRKCGGYISTGYVWIGTDGL